MEARPKNSPDNRANGFGAVSMPESNQQSKFTLKWQNVLAHFLNGGRLNRFEAERVVFDHCLNTTISSLSRDYGLKFERVFETVPCLRGTKTTDVKRYWLEPTPENLALARRVLGVEKST
jgi:hypothetical protein